MPNQDQQMLAAKIDAVPIFPLWLLISLSPQKMDRVMFIVADGTSDFITERFLRVGITFVSHINCRIQNPSVSIGDYQNEYLNFSFWFDLIWFKYNNSKVQFNKLFILSKIS